MMTSTTEISYSEAVREALRYILNNDPSAFLMGEDIGVYGGAFKITRGFIDEFGPQRIIETPISEASIVGMACGAALAGSRPIVEIMFMDFLLLALDPLVNAACKWPWIYGEDLAMPVIIRCPAGGGRAYGPTHSQSFEGMLANVPNLNIFCPATAQDAVAMLMAAWQSNNPTIVIEPKALYARKQAMPQDRSRWFVPAQSPWANIVRPGRHITLVTYGRMLIPALQAAAFLAEQDAIETEVIDLRSIKPLDTQTILQSAERTGRVITVEESPLFSGVGAEIAAFLADRAFGYLEAPIRRLGAADGPIPMAPPREKEHFPTTEKIIRTVRHLMDF